MKTQQSGLAGDSLRRRQILMRLPTYVLMAVPLYLSYDFFVLSDPSTDYYATVAQVIAAMYLAVALESFTGGGITLGRLDRAEFAVLLSLSWLGLLACLRGIATGEGSWLAGLGGLGLMASILLVTTNLANRVSIQNPRLVGVVSYIACLAPLIIFIPPR